MPASFGGMESSYAHSLPSMDINSSADSKVSKDMLEGYGRAQNLLAHAVCPHLQCSVPLPRCCQSLPLAQEKTLALGKGSDMGKQLGKTQQWGAAETFPRCLPPARALH